MSDVTSPDSIYIHTNSDPQSLPVASAALATSVQRAFDTRQIHTYRWADSIERAAQDGMVEGDLGTQADSGILYQYTAGHWKILVAPSTPYPVQMSGIVSVGNGVLEATYTRIGDQVNVEGSLTCGSTTSFNGSGFRATLPIDRAAKYDVGNREYAVGVCNFILPGEWDAPGIVELAATTPDAASFKAYRTVTDREYIGTRHADRFVPVPFTAGAMLTWNFSYRAAI